MVQGTAYLLNVLQYMATDLKTCTISAGRGRTAAEEFANAITHGVGLALAVVGASLMVASAWRYGDVWRMLGCGIYVASLIAVYAMSTLSHGCWSPRWKARFRAWDQGFIYFLIAATYTPFALAYLRTGAWWLLLAAIWAIALWGFVTKVVFAHRVEAVSVWPCFLLGWMPAVAVPSILELVPVTALWWMLAGGVCYTVGTIFLTLDEKVPHFHAVWHLLVIAGSACHFLAIFAFVARMS
jgi:hemolysin III